MVEWKKFLAYRVFDEFIEQFIINKKSYVTKHPQVLDLKAGLAEIHELFVDNYDDSKDSFDSKLKKQFETASEQAKIIFSNIEYLWAMPSSTLTVKTKRRYALRWFPETLINNSNQLFFGDSHIVAATGPYYSRNKFWEICVLLELVSVILEEGCVSSISEVKLVIEEFLYGVLYDSKPSEIKTTCSVRNMYLHLSNPDKYEAIVSFSHKSSIINVFSYLLSDVELGLGIEEKLKIIRCRIFNNYGVDSDAFDKERWFFYQGDIIGLWKGKSAKDCRQTSIRLEVASEACAEDIEGDSGSSTSTRLKRSSKLASESKKRDRHTCLACNFHYNDVIVHTHHLDPLSERKAPKLTKLEDLVTLCPNCHYLAHHLLRQNLKYKAKENLIDKLKILNTQIYH